MDIYFSNDDVRTNVLKTPISVCSMQEQIYFINSKHSFIGNIHLSLCVGGDRCLSVFLSAANFPFMNQLSVYARGGEARATIPEVCEIRDRWLMNR